MKIFFGFTSPADYAKELINIKNVDKSKGIVEEIEDRISDLENRIKEINEKEKKNVKETLQIIRKILDYNKNAQSFFHRASKVDKRKSEPKIEESIAERTKLRRQKLDTIATKKKKEKENINNDELFSY